MLSKHFRKNHGPEKMSTIEESVEVNVPVGTAYNQWTQFTEFPKFMKGVKEVQQVDPTHLHWRAVVAGREEEWDSRITEQIPDNRIAWCSTSGPKNAGVVTFHKISDSTSRIMLQMDYAPQDFVEGIGDGDAQQSQVFQGISGRARERNRSMEGSCPPTISVRSSKAAAGAAENCKNRARRAYSRKINGERFNASHTLILHSACLVDRGTSIGSLSNRGMLVPRKARQGQLKGGVSHQ